MCGIAGFLERDPAAPADAALAKRMGDALVHRGPDGEGFHVAGPVALAHRRLSIIDLAGGAQPMHARAGEASIVYNGEVYNFRELRAELKAAGMGFETDSDTEVVLAAYLHFGNDFVQHLNGMFACAIWDARQRRLVLARDRFGIKPLYIAETADRWAFASEIKGLLEVPGVDREWNHQALHDYFHMGYTPGEATAYRGIRQLGPGKLAVIEGGALREETYWELAPAPSLGASQDIESFEALLQDAVRMRMVADVPLGAFLSGGVDSGLVVAYMSQASEGPVNSFTVYDPNVPYYDERTPAAEVAARYSTQHRELAAAADVDALIGRIVPTFDEPFADSGAFPNLVVCREGRKLVTVALSGLGGDELSGGYVRYRGMEWLRALGFLPAGFSRPLSFLADRLGEGQGLAGNRIKRLARLVGRDPASAYARMVGIVGRLDTPPLAAAFLRDVDPESAQRRIAQRFDRAKEMGLDRVNQLLYTDLTTYVPDDLLRLADRTSMAESLEVRVPFLDDRLAERALAIPAAQKVNRRELKILLRSLARTQLPASVVDGAKRGFSVPMAEWLRGPLAAVTDRAVREVGPATGVLDRDALVAAWDEHRSGTANHEETLWASLMFSMWAEAQ